MVQAAQRLGGDLADPVVTVGPREQVVRRDLGLSTLGEADRVIAGGVEDPRDAAAAGRDWTAVAAADLAFHRALVEAAGSSRLSRMYDTVQAETRLCLHLLIGGYRSSAGLAAEHRRLAALAVRGDLDAALGELGRHLADPIRYLRRLGAAPPSPDTP